MPTYVSLAQTARITEQSVRAIRRRVSDGSLPAYEFGPRHIRIRLEDLEALGATHAQQPLVNRPPEALLHVCGTRTWKEARKGL